MAGVKLFSKYESLKDGGLKGTNIYGFNCIKYPGRDHEGQFNSNILMNYEKGYLTSISTFWTSSHYELTGIVISIDEGLHECGLINSFNTKEGYWNDDFIKPYYPYLKKGYGIPVRCIKN